MGFGVVELMMELPGCEIAMLREVALVLGGQTEAPQTFWRFGSHDS